MENPLVLKIVDICKERDNILKNGGSISKYNRYFDRMVKYAHRLVRDGNAAQLLPFLNDKSISMRFDIACLLYNHYPEKCRKILNLMKYQK